MKTTSTSTKMAPPIGSTIFGICQSGLGADTTTGIGFLVCGLRALELRHHVLRGLLDLLERAALADALHVGDLPRDGRPVLGQIVRERGDLAEERPSDSDDEQDCQDHDDDD